MSEHSADRTQGKKDTASLATNNPTKTPKGKKDRTALTKALRDNLKKRKAQARGQKEQGRGLFNMKQN